MTKRISIKKIISGTVAGLVITAILLFAFSVVLLLATLPDGSEELFSIVATIVGVMAGGAISSFKTECSGWLSGGLTGILYIIILCLISGFVFGSPGIVKLAITLIIGFLTGAVGGIIGINLRVGRRTKKRHLNNYSL